MGFNQIIFKNLWKWGSDYRNPSLNAIYKSLKISEQWTLDQLTNNQYIKLKEMLEFVYAYSPFYKGLFEKHSFNPSVDFNSLTDLYKVPVINKADLLDHNKDVHTVFTFKKCFVSETSGSSGQALKFQKDEYWDSFNRASIMRGYSWYGVNIWDKNGYFWGYNIAKEKRWRVRLFDDLQNRFRLFSYDEGNIRRFIAKLNNSTYLSGYSSMIYEVAKIINAKGLDTSGFRLKMIKGTSEKIFDSYQTEVKKAFGQKIIGEYGAAESGIIAFECPEGNMHINMEGVIVEEEGGEIIVTNLVAKSFPIIRYKLGDYIKLKPESYQCPCGMSHPVIESVLGRVGKLVYGKVKTYPSLTFYYVFKNLALNHKLELNYQAVQNVKGILVINIEQSIDKSAYSLIGGEMQKYFGLDIEYTINENQDLHQKNGKLMDFISSIE